MNEGGQSSTGQVCASFLPIVIAMLMLFSQLIDFILTNHPAYPELTKIGKEKQKNIHASTLTLFIIFYSSTAVYPPILVLQETLDGLQAEQGLESLLELTKDLHMYPDLHG
jgi:hypothetical protein